MLSIFFCLFSSVVHTLFRTFEAAKNESEIRAHLLKYDEMVFIFKQNFGKNKVNFFHHLSLIEGNFYKLQEHFGAIQGLDEEVTSIVTPELSELLDGSTIASLVPLIEDYMKIKSKNNLKNLKASVNGLYYTARYLIPVPPFMLHELNVAVLESDGDSKEVFVAAIKVIKEFDVHVDKIRDNQIEKAKDSCIKLLHWLFLASKGMKNSIPTVACSVRGVKRHFNIIQSSLGIKKNVLKTAGHSDILSKSIQKPLEIIAASSSSTQDFLSKLTQIQSSNQEKTSNLFGKLLDRVQNMIHVASSRGNIVPTTLNDEASQFFISSNFSKAQ